MTVSKNPSTGNAENASAEKGDLLGSTVGVFETRLQRRLKEQEVQEDQSQKEREARHARMLQAMTTIRKALQETCKIRLGDRFNFDLDVNDWEGWPRVELNLIDCHAPNRRDYRLVVTANDRNDQGTVNIAQNSGAVLGRVHLKDPTEFTRLPLILKKTVRTFLDEVAAYVLDPVKPEDLLETETKVIETKDFDEISQTLADTDLFTDDLSSASDNVVETTGDVEPIASLSLQSK